MATEPRQRRTGQACTQLIRELLFCIWWREPKVDHEIKHTNKKTLQLKSIPTVQHASGIHPRSMHAVYTVHSTTSASMYTFFCSRMRGVVRILIVVFAPTIQFFNSISLLNTARYKIGSAIGAGAVFNVANLLLVVAIQIVGLSTAFPLGIGTALVGGTVLTYVVI